jgi:hypothetical protein
MTSNQGVKDTTVDVTLIEEFFNMSDDEQKIINAIKDEFTDYKFFNYGSLVYMQNESDIDSFPHVSELLENYEKIYATVCYTEHLVHKMTKCNLIIFI